MNKKTVLYYAGSNVRSAFTVYKLSGIAWKYDAAADLTFMSNLFPCKEKCNAIFAALGMYQREPCYQHGLLPVEHAVFRLRVKNIRLAYALHKTRKRRKYTKTLKEAITTYLSSGNGKI